MPSPQNQPAATGSAAAEATRYRIGALLYFRDAAGRVLLIQRRRQPNLGLWCAVGGKLEMATGESPFECAVREAKEEVGVALTAADLALRCMVAERSYQESGHWLMFVFLVRPPLPGLPASIDEGCFQFFPAEELESVAMPALDRCMLRERVLKAGSSGALHILRAGPEAEADPTLVVEEERIGETP